MGSLSIEQRTLIPSPRDRGPLIGFLYLSPEANRRWTVRPRGLAAFRSFLRSIDEAHWHF